MNTDDNRQKKKPRVETERNCVYYRELNSLYL